MKKDKGKKEPRGFRETQQPLEGAPCAQKSSLKKGKMSAALEAALDAVENMEKNKRH